MKVTVKAVPSYTLLIKGTEFGGFKPQGKPWEGFVKLVGPRGDYLIVKPEDTPIERLFARIFDGELDGSSRKVEVVEASASLLPLLKEAYEAAKQELEGGE